MSSFFMPGFVLSRSRDKLALLDMSIPSYEEKGSGANSAKLVFDKNTTNVESWTKTEFAWVFGAVEKERDKELSYSPSCLTVWCPSHGDEWIGSRNVSPISVQMPATMQALLRPCLLHSGCLYASAAPHLE